MQYVNETFVERKAPAVTSSKVHEICMGHNSAETDAHIVWCFSFVCSWLSTISAHTYNEKGKNVIKKQFFVEDMLGKKKRSSAICCCCY